jgi:hypothetical protein
MKLIHYKHSFLIYGLLCIHLYFLISCNTRSYNSKHNVSEIGFLGFYLDMDYIKVKSTMDSLLKNSELYYFETTDILGNKQKNLYHDFPEISPRLCAKINLTGSLIIDERLTGIQLTLCSRSNTEEQSFLYNCDVNEIEKLFEIYKEKYGRPAILAKGEKYNWLSKRISNIYVPGPKGRWIMDKIYFWEKGDYIIYFDLGYPESSANSNKPITETDATKLHDSTSAPIIYYDFTQDYTDKLLEKASRIKEEKKK